jgi:hypothetical protein
MSISSLSLEKICSLLCLLLHGRTSTLNVRDGRWSTIYCQTVASDLMCPQNVRIIGNLPPPQAHGVAEDPFHGKSV